MGDDGGESEKILKCKASKYLNGDRIERLEHKREEDTLIISLPENHATKREPREEPPRGKQHGEENASAVKDARERDRSISRVIAFLLCSGVFQHSEVAMDWPEGAGGP